MPSHGAPNHKAFDSLIRRCQEKVREAATEPKTEPGKEYRAVLDREVDESVAAQFQNDSNGSPVDYDELNALAQHHHRLAELQDADCALIDEAAMTLLLNNVRSDAQSFKAQAAVHGLVSRLHQINRAGEYAIPRQIAAKSVAYVLNDDPKTARSYLNALDKMMSRSSAATQWQAVIGDISQPKSAQELPRFSAQ